MRKRIRIINAFISKYLMKRSFKSHKQRCCPGFRASSVVLPRMFTRGNNYVWDLFFYLWGACICLLQKCNFLFLHITVHEFDVLNVKVQLTNLSVQKNDEAYSDHKCISFQMKLSFKSHKQTSDFSVRQYFLWNHCFNFC